MQNKLETLSKEGLRMLQEAFRTYMNAVVLCADLDATATATQIVNYVRPRLGSAFLVVCRELLELDEMHVVAHIKTLLKLRGNTPRRREILSNAKDYLWDVAKHVAEGVGMALAEELIAIFPHCDTKHRSIKLADVRRLLDIVTTNKPFTAKLLSVLSYVYPRWEKTVLEELNAKLASSGKGAR